MKYERLAVQVFVGEEHLSRTSGRHAKITEAATGAATDVEDATGTHRVKID
jgi:hypothetical protein